MTVQYNFPEPGCYVDCCRGLLGPGGQYDKITQIAAEYGFDCPEFDANNYESAEAMAEEAIDYLNSLESRDDYCWGFENGDFGLWVAEA